MKAVWVAIAVLFLLAAFIGAVRSVWQGRPFPFLKKLDESTRHAYLALAILGVALLLVAFFPDLRVQSVDVAGIKATVGKLETKVDTLSDQMEAFFKRKRIEVFDRKHNWKRVHLVHKVKAATQGLWKYTFEFTLEQDPIPESVEVWWGIIAVTDFRAQGKVLTIDFETTDSPFANDLDLRVTYYPRGVIPAAKGASDR